jgi:hypothetical protein
MFQWTQETASPVGSTLRKDGQDSKGASQLSSLEDELRIQNCGEFLKLREKLETY